MIFHHFLTWFSMIFRVWKLWFHEIIDIAYNKQYFWCIFEKMIDFCQKCQKHVKKCEKCQFLTKMSKNRWKIMIFDENRWFWTCIFRVRGGSKWPLALDTRRLKNMIFRKKWKNFKNFTIFSIFLKITGDI